MTAIIASTLILIGYSWWVKKNYAVPAPKAQTAEKAGSGAESAPAAKAVSKPSPKKAPAVSLPSRAKAVTTGPGAGKIRVETRSLKAVFSAEGGRLLSWKLKSYQALGTTVCEDLIPLKAANAAMGALSVRLSNQEESAGARARSSAASLDLSGADPKQTGTVDFTTYLSGGRVLTKSVTFPAEGYEIGLDIALSGPAPSHLDVIWYPGIGYSKDEEEMLGRQGTYQNDPLAVVLTSEKRIKQRVGKKPKEQSGTAPFWAALGNRYFVAALVSPALSETSGVESVEGLAESEGESGNLLAGLRFHLKQGASDVRIPLRLYAGPKQYETLKDAGSRLEKAIDLGFFGSLALWLLKTLKFFARFVHNYGVAIILLTVLVKLILWFPSQWGLDQMKRIKEIQPQIKFVTEKFKDEPQRKQEEMMRLYREYKVNPLGGCLPILLQIPVFFALWSALNSAIELRGAPFVFWIQDLSSKDPYYIMPVMVGVTMWIQQAMTPVAGDPSQAKMMRWMSLVFVVMFATMPSGLMIYWLTQNIIQIAQQWFTNKSTAAAGTRR